MRRIMYSFCSPRKNLFEDVDPTPFSKISSAIFEIKKDPGESQAGAP
jgi:hypothetical protein